MKIPIEFIGTEKNPLQPIDDSPLPKFPLKLKFSETERLALESLQIRANIAGDQAKKLENVVLKEIGSLSTITAEVKTLNLDELRALIEEVQKAVDQMAAIRIKLLEIIAEYAGLTSSFADKDWKEKLASNRIDRLREQLLDEILQLQKLNESYRASLAYMSSLHLVLYEDAIAYITDNLKYMDSYVKNLTATTKNVLNVTFPPMLLVLANLQDVIEHYECWSTSLAKTSLALLEMYRALYKYTRKQWLRLISGSYVRRGKNINLNRHCVRVYVSASMPPLTDCDPPQFLPMPYPEYRHIDPNEKECPPCIEKGSSLQALQSLTAENFTLTDVGIRIIDSSPDRIFDDDLSVFLNGTKVGELYNVKEPIVNLDIIVPSTGALIEFFVDAKHFDAKKIIGIELEDGTTIFSGKIVDTTNKRVGSLCFSHYISPVKLNKNIKLNASTKIVKTALTTNQDLVAQTIINPDQTLPYFFVYTENYINSSVGAAVAEKDWKTLETWGKDNGLEPVRLTDTRQILSIFNSKIGQTFYYRE